MTETPAGGFRNKKLLLVAVLLALAFVVLFNVQSCRDEARRRRERMGFALVLADLSPGQVLRKENVELVYLPGEVGERVKGLLPWKDVFPGQTVVKRFVAKNSLLRLMDTGEVMGEHDALTSGMKRQWRTISLAVDNKGAAAGYIRRGSRVDLYGAIRVPGRPAETQLIIEYLEVMGVGGRVDAEATRRDFRSVDVQVPAGLVGGLLEVKRRVIGRMTLAVRRPDDSELMYPYDPGNPQMGGTIAKPVMDSLARPFASTPAGRLAP